MGPGPNDLDDDDQPNDDMFKRSLAKRVYHFRIPFRGRDKSMFRGPDFVRKYRYRFMRDSDNQDDADDDDDDNDSRAGPWSNDIRDLDGGHRFFPSPPDDDDSNENNDNAG